MPTDGRTLDRADEPAAHSAVGCFHDERCRLRLERYQARLRAMALELSLTAQRERRRLAEGLHDHVGQSLAVARLQLDALRRATDDEDQVAAIADVIAVLGDALEETRRLTFEMSPPLLYELGLEAALRCLATRMRSTHGLSCRLDCDEEPKPLAPDVAATAFAVVRELLHNVVKHAQARSVRVTVVRTGDRVRIEVADDGAGFEQRHESVPFDSYAGFGLFSCRERLVECGGALDVVSVLGHGTRVLFDVPLSERPVA